jgi:hypothetical protein
MNLKLKLNLFPPSPSPSPNSAQHSLQVEIHGVVVVGTGDPVITIILKAFTEGSFTTAVT